jgi:hypothetical protein
MMNAYQRNGLRITISKACSQLQYAADQLREANAELLSSAPSDSDERRDVMIAIDALMRLADQCTEVNIP